MMIETGLPQSEESSAIHRQRGRSVPRFVLLTDLPPTTARAGVSRAPTRVTWSLVSANNRPLGRAAANFDSVAAGIEAAERLRRGAPGAVVSVVRRDQDGERRAYWTWTVRIDDQPVAMAASRYARRFECTGSVQRFLDAVAVASPAPPAVLRVGTRLLDVSG